MCTRARVGMWALRRVACTDLTRSGYNGNQYRVLRNISSAHRVHPLCLLPEPGTTVVRPIRGRPGGVLVLDFRCTRKWLFDDRVYPFLIISVFSITLYKVAARRFVFFLYTIGVHTVYRYVHRPIHRGIKEGLLDGWVYNIKL